MYGIADLLELLSAHFRLVSPPRKNGNHTFFFDLEGKIASPTFEELFPYVGGGGLPPQ